MELITKLSVAMFGFLIKHNKKLQVECVIQLFVDKGMVYVIFTLVLPSPIGKPLKISIIN